MSKLANKPLKISSKVRLVLNGSNLKVQGPKGELSRQVSSEVGIEILQDEVRLFLHNPNEGKALLGTEFALLRNACIGVETGHEKRLLLVGVGFKAVVSGKTVELSLGYSHPVRLEIPEGLNVVVEKQTLILVQGIDKQKVGLFASVIREWRKPEPYKGKGVRYENEFIKLKAGKSSGKK